MSITIMLPWARISQVSHELAVFIPLTSGRPNSLVSLYASMIDQGTFIYPIE